MGTICGTLTGEHLYVDLSPTSADTLTITIAEFLLTTAPSAAIAQRTWDFQTSQIPCYATYRAPAGCMRYLTTDSGKITSLNFYKISGSSTGANLQNSALQLGSQNVNTCIRRSKGMCSDDYVEIPSSWTGQCGHRGVGAINTRYCGSKFGGNLFYTVTLGQASSSQGVCDCSEPFVVRHGTDFSADRGGPAFASSDAAAQLVVPNRGFCLDFLQQPCSA